MLEALARRRRDDPRSDQRRRGSSAAARIGIRVACRMLGRRDSIDGTHLLIAAGRAANVAGLDLEKAGIAYDGKGINGHQPLRTTNRRVYAVGDVVRARRNSPMSPAITPASSSARCCSACRQGRTASIIPRVTFTDPELAHVGLTEAEAVARKLRPHQHPALALCRERPRPGRARDRRASSRW